MRFVWAVVAFVLATLLIAAGIGQRTVFMGPSSQQEEIAVTEPAPFALIDGDVLRMHPGLQSLIVRGEGEIFAAYARTGDMQAWLADSSYNEVTLDGEGAVEVTFVEPKEPAAADAEEGEEAEKAEKAPPVRNPVGSDLWLDSFSDKDQLITDMQLPEGVSVLIAIDGEQPAPSDIVVSWPLDTSTPWAGPLMAAGGALMLVGLILYILGIRHQRRGRGPLRKGPGPLPPTEPIQIESAPERAAIASGATADDQDAASETEEVAEGEIIDEPDTSSSRAERVAVPRRRLVLPALGLTAVVALTGCSADSWPQLGGAEATPTPSPSETVLTPEDQKPPAVTEAQATRIVQEIADTLATADEDRDIKLAATRLEGAALDARRTDYKLRAKLKDREAPAALPTDSLEIILPQATDAWPRTVLVLSKQNAEETQAPVIFTMTQADPWSDYKISDMAEMQASAELLDVAPAWLGTTLVPPDLTFLSIAPGELAEAFADVVDEGEKSEQYALFDESALSLAASITESRDSVVATLKKNGAEKTSKASFDISPTDYAPAALATLDSGAIVAVSLIDSETIKPTTDDAVIKFGENPAAKVLTGVEESAKGVTTKYGLQLFFAVPAQGSPEPVRLLAVRQDLLNVKVIK